MSREGLAASVVLSVGTGPVVNRFTVDSKAAEVIWKHNEFWFRCRFRIRILIKLVVDNMNGIIGAFILYMALVITEATCKYKKVSTKKAFFYGFASLFLTFIVLLFIGEVMVGSYSNSGAEHRYLWFLGGVGLGIASGAKVAMACESADY